MEEVTLQAVKRAMPGHGRARINTSLLAEIGIEDNNEVEVVTSSGGSLTLAAFADALVDKSQIRIGESDLKKLGITEGDMVTVRRKTPVTEQVKTAAEDLADKISKNIQDAGEVLSDKASELKAGSTQAARDISEKARDVSAKISEQVMPIGEKISEAGRDAAAKIQDLVPTGRYNAAVEAGLKRLKPEDVAELKKVLLQTKGDVILVTVSAETAAGRAVRNLTIPPDVTVAAVQKGDNTLVLSVADATIQMGDQVYLIGAERGLEYMAGILVG